MAFTVRCGVCFEPAGKHIIVRTKHGQRSMCPEEHLARWLNKWGWKYERKDGSLNFEAAQHAWEKVVARLPKAGGGHGTRRPKPGSKARHFPKTECGFCGISLTHRGAKTDKRYKLLCHKCAKHVEKIRELAKKGKFGHDPGNPTYYVTIRYFYRGSPRQLVVHVTARTPTQAKELAAKHLPKEALWISAVYTKVKHKKRFHKSKKRLRR